MAYITPQLQQMYIDFSKESNYRNMKQEEKAKLRSDLKAHYGSIKKVAEKAKVTPKHVRAVLVGERNNDEILAIASEVLVELEKEKAQRRQRVEKARQLADTYMQAVA